MNKLKGLIVLLLCICSFAWADYDPWGIPDSSEVRKALRERWFTAPLSTVRTYGSEIFQSKIGTNYQVRKEEQNGEIAIIVSPEQNVLIDVYTGNEKNTTVESSIYPETAPGSWILYRNLKNGKPKRIRYYFMSNSEIFVEFNAVGKKTNADFVMFDMYAAKGVPLGITFETLYSMSFADLRKLTKSSLPWYLASSQPGMYHSNLQMIAVIRENLDSIESVEDGAYNEKGESVYVLSNTKRELKEGENPNKLQLSSAGFLKWIVDGLVSANVGGYTYLKPLYKKTVSLPTAGHADVFSQEYNMTFTLDWTRNLAVSLLSIQRDVDYDYSNSGVDVAISPFNSGRLNNGEVTANAVSYIKNSGYRIGVLKALLYVLAITESDHSYLVSVREAVASEKNDDSYPEVGIFNNCAALFPYFSDDGRFHCAVFENGKEIALDKFIEKYEGSFVNLARLQSSDRFFPLAAPSKAQ